jgi:hypothetical protein
MKPGVLAVIDLADTLHNYKDENYKVAGICFNNIANI